MDGENQFETNVLLNNIQNDVRNIVKYGYDNNLSQDEIAENISKAIQTINNTRAKTIARTEINRTATVSDYIINKERGATHFVVDCRKTCCDICRKDYNFGKVEYDMETDVDKLPPRHPNCRCYAKFYKKEQADESNIFDSSSNNDMSNFKFNNQLNNSNHRSVKLIDSEKNVKVNFYEDENLLIDNTERFTKYIFDNGLEIYLSEDCLFEKLLLIKEAYDNLPPILKSNIDKIIISNQELKYKHSSGSAGGYISPNAPDNRIIIGYNKRNKQVGTVQHEAAHLLEYNKNFYISNSQEYIRACIEDSAKREKLSKDEIVPGGNSTFIERVKNKDENVVHRPLSEDLAISVNKYLLNPTKFKMDYPARAGIIEKILNGTFEATESDFSLDDIIRQVFK